MASSPPQRGQRPAAWAGGRSGSWPGSGASSNTWRPRLPWRNTVTPLRPSSAAWLNTWRTASTGASAGRFTVLDTPLSVWAWKAACTWRCRLGGISWAVANRRASSAGSPCTAAARPLRLRASRLAGLSRPSSFSRAAKRGLSSDISSPSRTRRV